MTAINGSRRQWEAGELLGSGGFGEVYYVLSPNQGAVIKLVPKVPGAEREYLVEDLSGVRNIIPLLDRGETQDKWAFVMPRADKDLRVYLSEQPDSKVGLRSALQILIDIAEALADLDSKQVVHRDLKPENVLLLNGRWCLTDFGISRYAEATTAPDTRKYALSAPYAAPEQWRSERATPAADVYAFGVIAYEILSGARPFKGPDLRDDHLHSQPASLASVPTPLASLVDQCLSKAPGSRPRSADVLSRLQRQASEAPVTGGLAALQEANRLEVARMTEAARSASEAETEAERRSALLQDAQRQLHSMATTLMEAIRSAAPVAAVSELVAGVGGGRPTHGWRIQLSGAKVGLHAPRLNGRLSIPLNRGGLRYAA